MSTHVDSDAQGRFARLRHSMLSGYYFLRSSLWRSLIVFGVILSLVALGFDRFGIHDIFAGMFGVWGLSTIVGGVLGYLVISAIRAYARLSKETY